MPLLDLFLPAATRCVRTMLLMIVAAALGGCASYYVDKNTPEVPVAQFVKPPQPHPVQMLFEFQTKGVTNTRATDFLKMQVTDQVRASGLFSEVGDKPAAGGAVLSVKVNNVPLTDDAFTKGFVTGLTFGLAGSKVSDGYVCTFEYVGPKQGDPIRKTERHAIHTLLGAGSAPPEGVKANSLDMAVRTMMHQLVSAGLNDLSHDAKFE